MSDIIFQVLGWILYLVMVAYTVSGCSYIWMVVRRGGSISYMGHCQWAMTLTGSIIFALTDFNKLHIAWLIPLVWMLSFSPIGYLIGYIAHRIIYTLASIFQIMPDKDND